MTVKNDPNALESEIIKILADLITKSDFHFNKREMTIPEILNRGRKENFMSDYLAHILNPNVNGIGDAPIRALLELCKRELPKEYKEIKVERESPLTKKTRDSQGRIDILITIETDPKEKEKKFVIGIENKIDSKEHGDQTESYARLIKNKYIDYDVCLIFLSPLRDKPLSDEFKLITYKDVFESLSASVQLGSFSDYRNLLIFNDFLSHIKENIAIGGKHKSKLAKSLISPQFECLTKLRNIVEKKDEPIPELKKIESIIEKLEKVGVEIEHRKNIRNYIQAYFVDKTEKDSYMCEADPDSVNIYKESWSIKNKIDIFFYLLFYEIDDLKYNRLRLYLYFDNKQNEKFYKYFNTIKSSKIEIVKSYDKSCEIWIKKYDFDFTRDILKLDIILGEIFEDLTSFEKAIDDTIKNGGKTK